MQPIAGLIDSTRVDISMRIVASYTIRKAYELWLGDREQYVILFFVRFYAVSAFQLMIRVVNFLDSLAIIHLHDRLA
jgi:hypothetical protein